MNKRQTGIAVLLAGIVILAVYLAFGLSRIDQEGQGPADSAVLTSSRAESENQAEAENNSEAKMAEKEESDKLSEPAASESSTQKPSSDESAEAETQESYMIPITAETETESLEPFAEGFQGGYFEGEADTSF